MKWITLNLRLYKTARTFRALRRITQVYIVLAFISLLILLLAGIIGIVQQSVSRSPISSMQGVASTLPREIFLDMMGMEVAGLSKGEPTKTFSPSKVLKFLFRLTTNLNPNDPKSLLAQAIPGLDSERATLLYSGNNPEVDVPPVEYAPPANVFQDENPVHVLPPAEKSTVDSSGVEKTVLIYHSHNRESWLPELKNVKNPDLALDAKTNVTLVGKRIAKKLETLGVGVTHSNRDYPSTVDKFTYPKSYQYSKQTLKEAFATNSNLTYLFDIHRDSQKRSKTTVTINQQDYAQIYFVVGEKNPNWEQNMEFAKKINDRLNEKYPGLSKGIYGKNSNGNGEYNQSFSPNSSLIEIGGIENTLEESYRTADLLAEVIAEIVTDTTKVGTPTTNNKTSV